MVAAGGGGADYYTPGGHTSHGGAGGGLIGINGISSWQTYYGTGGTQSATGYLYNSPSTNLGNFGYGGIGTNGSNYGGGGGGAGYYGGGGGNGIAGGGGGSSYISGYEGCSSIEEESTVNNIIHNGSKYHYSNNYFINTLITSGTNTGNGKATIKLVSKEENTTSEVLSKINKNTFNYYYSGNGIFNGRYQIFEVPKSGTYKIEAWGAAGGTINSSGVGGKGAYTYGEIKLNKGTKLYVYVGSKSYINTVGGWNGGGNGTNGSQGTARGGGGASDIRVSATTSITSWNEFTSLKSRIMVAAGGGGADYYTAGSHTSHGGAGGGLIGINGTSSWQTYYGTGGTQLQGGSLKTSTTTNVGGFGYGAVGTNGSNYGGGGGGAGWYGGGGGNGIAGGGGGSSYISGHAGCIGVNSSGNPLATEYSKLADSISYTGYTFTNTQIVDGQGYPWTTVRGGTSSSMPSPTTSSLISGNDEDGYIKIFYLGS